MTRKKLLKKLLFESLCGYSLKEDKAVVQIGVVSLPPYWRSTANCGRPGHARLTGLLRFQAKGSEQIIAWECLVPG